MSSEGGANLAHDCATAVGPPPWYGRSLTCLVTRRGITQSSLFPPADQARQDGCPMAVLGPDNHINVTGIGPTECTYGYC